MNTSGLEDYYLSTDEICSCKSNCSCSGSFLDPIYNKTNNYFSKTVDIKPNKNLDFAKVAGSNNKHTFPISKIGHFLHSLHLTIDVPELVKTSGTFTSWTNGFMYAFIEKIELEIGGKIIDTRYSQDLDIEDELVEPYNQRIGLPLMTGKDFTPVALYQNALTSRNFNLPLKFWFSTSYKNSLPIFLLENVDINIHVYTRSFIDTISYDGPTPPNEVSVTNSYILAEYLYVEKSILKKFVDKSSSASGLTYIISQCQHRGKEVVPANSTLFNTSLSFNYPVKELRWVFIETESINNSDHFNYSRRVDNRAPMLKAKLTLDGRDLHKDFMNESYFRLINSNIRHTSISDKYINSHQFSYDPESVDPTGSLNFNNIHSFQLYTQMATGNQEMNLLLYAYNYNILTVKDGLCYIRYIT